MVRYGGTVIRLVRYGGNMVWYGGAVCWYNKLVQRYGLVVRLSVDTANFPAIQDSYDSIMYDSV